MDSRTPECKTGRLGANAVGLPTLFALLGCLAAMYLHWPALMNYSAYKGDIMQSPHWAAYHRSSFRSDDLLLKYARYNESPLQNLIYYTGTYFMDMVWLTKVVAIVSYGLCAMLFFCLGRSMFGVTGGALSALFFTFFPDQFEYFVGGFSKAWMIPLLLACVYLLEEQRWRALGLLLPFAALAYPMSAVLIGMTTAVYLVMQFGRGMKSLAPVLRTLLPGCVCVLALLLVKYLSPPDFIGPMRSTAELLGMPEMYRVGFYKILPIPRLHEDLLDRISHPFVIGSALLFFVLLGRNGLGWRRSWTALFIASVSGYLLSALLFMRLYIPNRYTRYSVAVLLALWLAHNWDLLLRKIPWRWARTIAVIAVLGVAWCEYRDNFRQGKETMDRSKVAPLCEYLRHLPDGVLIAGPPYIMDDIPIQARRSVLVNYKLAHPWFTKYYDEVKKRTLMTFEALYASSPDPINRLHEGYEVNYLVTENDAYDADALSDKEIYVEPFNEFIARIIHKNKHFLLANPPAASIVYRDNRYTVLKLPLPDENQ
ncbi:MAG: hypothetical protein HY318_14920 [Armatimonadetes bacterium]|nr:hypothetical protein [Armatimonadota bacterium]